MSRLRTVAVAGVVAASLARPALAGEERQEREARARSLFDEGRSEMAAGHYSEACRRFVDSTMLDPGAGTMLNLAYCYEKLGREADAWAQYKAAASAARDQGRVDWEDSARARAKRLESQLVWVVVHVEKQPEPGLVAIRLDGGQMMDDALERPIPVDAGHHEVTATAADRRPWTKTFEADRERTSNITIPTLEPLEPPAPRPLGAREAPPAPREAQAVRSPGDPRRTAAWMLGGAGAATLAATGILGIIANATYSNADCIGNKCTAAGHDARSRAFVQGDVATGLAVGGGLALAGATVLWLTTPSHKTAVGVRAAIGASPLGVSVEGAW